MPDVLRFMSGISRPFAVVAVAAALTTVPAAVDAGMTDAAYAKGKGGDKTTVVACRIDDSVVGLEDPITDCPRMAKTFRWMCL